MTIALPHRFGRAYVLNLAVPTDFPAYCKQTIPPRKSRIPLSRRAGRAQSRVPKKKWPEWAIAAGTVTGNACTTR